MKHIASLQNILADTQARTGGEYHFILTAGGAYECAVMHWHSRHPWAASQVERVAMGSVNECIAALANYADEYHGSPPGKVDAPTIAEPVSTNRGKASEVKVEAGRGLVAPAHLDGETVS